MYTVLAILICLAPIVLFTLVNDASTHSSMKRNDEIRKKHLEMMEVIGETGNPLVIREQKARVETLIHSGLKEVDDIDYDPGDIVEVTTEEERRARRRAELAGKKYVHSWSRAQMELIIENMIKQTGATREELAARFPDIADDMARTYSSACDIDIEDAKYVVRQLAATLTCDSIERKDVSGANETGGEYYAYNNVRMIPVSSSAVRSIGYDMSTAKLYVEFTSGSEYEYDDVPSDVYTAFMSSRSKGRFVNDILTIGYHYRPIEKAKRS